MPSSRFADIHIVAEIFCLFSTSSSRGSMTDGAKGGDFIHETEAGTACLLRGHGARFSGNAIDLLSKRSVIHGHELNAKRWQKVQGKALLISQSN
jgi:hypothetical protein